MALNLITRQEYKAYAGIKSANEDALIDELIPRVSQFVKNYCRRSFVDYMDTPKVEVFNGGVPYLILSEGPVQSVTSVEFSSDYGQSYVPLVEYADWVLDDYMVVPISSTEFGRNIKGYKVTYTAGYDDVPYDVSLAAMDLVTYYRRNDSAIHNSKGPSSGSVQIEYLKSASLPAHIRRVLDLYSADFS